MLALLIFKEEKKSHVFKIIYEINSSWPLICVEFIYILSTLHQMLHNSCEASLAWRKQKTFPCTELSNKGCRVKLQHFNKSWMKIDARQVKNCLGNFKQMGVRFSYNITLQPTVNLKKNSKIWKTFLFYNMKIYTETNM